MKKFTPLFLIFFFICTSGFADDPHPTGFSIIKKQRDLQKGYSDFTATGTLLLKNREGELDTKRMFTFTEIESSKDVNGKILIKINFPPDLSGTGLLSLAQPNNQTNQYLYLSALKQTKQIVSAARGGRFLGSEFFYEDLVPYSWQSYDYDSQGEATIAGRPCYIVKLIPHETLQSLYGKILYYIDKEKLITLQTDFYSKKDEWIKSASFENHEKLAGQFLRPLKITMLNKLTGRSSELNLTDVKIKNGLNPDTINLGALER
ncbi:MAG: von Willebrand factor, type A [uncultured bacterium]|nr:MAG: von Willebrand factor, type A [uncultured bacterium]